MLVSLFLWILLVTVGLFLAIVLGVLYLWLLASLGVTTLQRGHFVLFAFGLLVPLWWIVGATVRPTARVRTALARASLRPPRPWRPGSSRTASLSP